MLSAQNNALHTVSAQPLFLHRHNVRQGIVGLKGCQEPSVEQILKQ